MLIDPVLGLKVQFILGILNIIFLLLVSSSCRCMGMHKFTKKLFNSERYIQFYNLHCYFWYGFFVSVVLHAILGIYLFGIPF